MLIRSRTSIRWACRALAVATLALPATAVLAQASPSTTSRSEPSRSQPDVDRAHEDEQLARDWGLTGEEWHRYRELMRGPLGIYSPNLDPLTALGIEARSAAERHHFAQLQVQAEGRRAEKTLAYQRAYDDAWRELYPGLRPLLAPDSTQTATPGSTVVAPDGSERLAVFVKDNCAACDERVRDLQAANRPFDIYMVGSQHDDNRIRQWAARVGIDPSKVKSHVVTLNHDEGRWLSLGGQGALPAVVTEVEGQWRRD